MVLQFWTAGVTTKSSVMPGSQMEAVVVPDSGGAGSVSLLSGLELGAFLNFGTGCYRFRLGMLGRPGAGL